jgi:hypothetical protein
MPRSWFSETEEYTGPVPSGGYKLQIEEIERGVNGENAQVPGAKRYMAVLRVTEPKKYAGTIVRDYFTIGTEDDPKARDQETWRTSAGAKKLVRLLKRAGIAARDGDDEEWQDAAQGQEVCAHVMRETDDRGTRNSVNGAYFRETDDEFVGVGEPLEAPSSRGGGKGGRSEKPARGGNGTAARPAARAARPPVDDDDDDDAPPARRGKPAQDDDEGDDDGAEEEKKPAAKKPAQKAAPKGGRKLPVKDDDDEDDD